MILCLPTYVGLFRLELCHGHMAPCVTLEFRSYLSLRDHMHHKCMRVMHILGIRCTSVGFEVCELDACLLYDGFLSPTGVLSIPVLPAVLPGYIPGGSEWKPQPEGNG